MKKSKHELFLEYKIKSTIIKNGWFILYSVLFPLFFALMFKQVWILFFCLIVFYPIYLMAVDIKRLKKEIKETRELVAAEDMEKEKSGTVETDSRANEEDGREKETEITAEKIETKSTSEENLDS